MIYNLSCRTSVKEVMKENELLTIDNLEKLETACFMHKYENRSLPLAFLNFFEENRINPRKKSFKNASSSSRTRSQSNFFPSYRRINVTKQSLKYKSPLLWNKIPPKLKQTKNYKKFRKEVKNYILVKL